MPQRSAQVAILELRALAVAQHGYDGEPEDTDLFDIERRQVLIDAAMRDVNPGPIRVRMAESVASGFATLFLKNGMEDTTADLERLLTLLDQLARLSAFDHASRREQEGSR